MIIVNFTNQTDATFRHGHLSHPAHPVLFPLRTPRARPDLGEYLDDQSPDLRSSWDLILIRYVSYALGTR